MGNLQFKKLFYWFAFLVLGFFSCYWTSDSLYIWQPALGWIGSWLLAILFYVMASLSFSLVLNAFNRNIDFYGKFLGRGASLFLGLIGLILFWLVCSMPTNTHTLLYNAEARNTVSKDLSETQNYLAAFENKNSAIEAINAKYENKEREINLIFVKMMAEMDDPSNTGIGIRFRTLVAELNTALSSINPNTRQGRSIQEAKNPGSNRTQWLATYYQYKSQVDDILRMYRRACDNEIAGVRKQMDSPELRKLIINCDSAKRDIDKMTSVSNNIIEQSVKDLTAAYAYIGANSSMIVFQSREDSMRYCDENAHPKIKALQVVPQVWKDFLTTDRYNGHGFAWWILISILVDIAGFIFFFLATK